MLGSNDDKKTPAADPASAAEKAAEKKDLFGWLRKKSQAGSAEPAPAVPPTPAAEPAPVTPAAPVPQAPAAAAPVSVEPAAAAPAAIEPVAEAAPAPRPSRFRINAGSEVLHAHIDVPVVQPEPVVPVSAAPVEPAPSEAKSSEESFAAFFDRLKQGL